MIHAALIGVVALLTTLAPPVAAQAVRPGDVVVSGTREFIVPPAQNSIGAYTPDAQFRIQATANFGGGDTLWSPDGTLSALDLYGDRLDLVSQDLQSVRTITVTSTSRASALATNAQGEIIVVYRNGELRWLSPSGITARLDSIPLETGAEIITADLGIDQCVLYFFALTAGVNDRIRRYDVCRRERLADLPQPLSYSFGKSTLRVMSDGSVLFTGRSSVFRFKDGATQIFPVPAGDVGLALAPASGSDTLWIAGSFLRKVNIATGAVLAGPTLLDVTSPSLTIYGVARASASALNAPSLGNGALIALVTLLLFVALYRLH